jgi:hypothetical protein
MPHSTSGNPRAGKALARGAAPESASILQLHPPPPPLTTLEPFVGVAVRPDFAVGVRVAVGGDVCVGVSVGVDVRVIVGVFVRLAVPVGIDTVVLVGLAVPVGVAPWATVIVIVADAASVAVGVGVGVRVAVVLGVADGVEVAVGVAVGVSVAIGVLGMIGLLAAKMSNVEFVSLGTRFVASDWKTIVVPSALICGAVLSPFASPPPDVTLARAAGPTTPLLISTTKMSAL